MIKYCVKKWNKNKDKLYNELKDDLNLNGCEYEYLVRLVVKHIRLICHINGTGQHGALMIQAT